MRVVMAGASGFLGSNLSTHLRTHGHEVTALIRREAQGSHESSWDPQADRIDQQVIDKADVVINMAGTPLLGNPHSQRYRDNLRSSRIDTTRVLAEAVAASPSPPAFIAQSGIAWYGDHGDEVITEQSGSRGDAFMTQLCRDWESAAAPAEEAGARVCRVRTVPVMHAGSKVLDMLRPVFRAGLGARLGSGQQYFPVISLRDWTSAVTFLVQSHDLSGAFSLGSPVPPTNAEFTHALARRLGRRAFVAAPSGVLRVVAGPLSSELLGSYNVHPEALHRAGFDFEDETVAEVLTAALA